jgi:hypothetical protein
MAREITEQERRAYKELAEAVERVREAEAKAKRERQQARKAMSLSADGEGGDDARQ